MALAAGPIFDVYQAGEVGDALGRSLDDAIRAIVPSVLVAGAAGLVIALAERAAEGRQGVERAARRAGLVATVLLALAVVALALLNYGRISDTVSEQWATLTGAEYSSVESARISNLDPYERPDYWRVAIDLFQQSPVGGVGTGNFEREYTARRHEPKHSRYVHNMYLRALGEGGAVAAALLVAFFLSLFAAGADAQAATHGRAGARPGHGHGRGRLLRRAPELRLARGDPGRRGAGVGPAAGGAGGSGAPRGALRQVPARGTLVASGGLGHGGGGRRPLVSMVPAYLAVRYVNRAELGSSVDVDAALADLDQARSLNPDSLDPDLSEGRIAISARRYGLAREAFEHSLTVEDNWLAHFEIALIDASRGSFAAASTELARARALNARDPVLTRLSNIIEARRKVDPKRENTRIQRAAQARFTTSGR